MNYLFRNIEHNEYFTFLILVSLLIILFIKRVYTYQFMEFLNVLTNGKYFILHNKGRVKKNLFNSLFYIFFAINISVFGFISLKSFGIIAKQKAVVNIFLFINIYFIGKYILEKIAFEILNLNQVFENYNFQKLTCVNFISVLIFLTNLNLLYILKDPSTSIIYFSISTFVFLYLISVTIIILFNQKTFLKHWFYFILYLCTFEIAPFIIGAILIETNLLNNLGV